MKVTLNQVGSDAMFSVTTEGGQTSHVHSPIQDGVEKQAPSPMETLLVAAAGCTSVDVLLILQKMKQKVENLSIDVEGIRTPKESAKPFSKISFVYQLEGEVDEKKANRAVSLAVEKYCSVLESLDPAIEIDYQVKIKN